MGKNIILTEEQLGNIINRLKPINESEITEGSDGNYMAKQVAVLERMDGL